MHLGENGHARWQMKPLCDAAQSGAIAWVREGYLKELRNQGSRLQRRQDLHPTVFRDCGRSEKASPFQCHLQMVVPRHPDPDGFHLACLVDVLTNGKADDDGVFFDFSNLYQCPRTESAKRDNGWQIICIPTFGCIVLSELPEGFDRVPIWQRGWYHLCKNNYSFDALQAYCFGINIKL